MGDYPSLGGVFPSAPLKVDLELSVPEELAKTRAYWSERRERLLAKIDELKDQLGQLDRDLVQLDMALNGVNKALVDLEKEG